MNAVLFLFFCFVVYTIAISVISVYLYKLRLKSKKYDTDNIRKEVTKPESQEIISEIANQDTKPKIKLTEFSA